MSKISIVLVVGIFIGLCPAPSLGAAAGPADAARTFFDASRNGDIETLRNIITGPFYTRRKALIERNAGYSEFLKDQFKGVEYDILKTELGSDNTSALVTVGCYYPDGSTLFVIYTLTKDHNGAWKIYNEELTEMP